MPRALTTAHSHEHTKDPDSVFKSGTRYLPSSALSSVTRPLSFAFFVFRPFPEHGRGAEQGGGTYIRLSARNQRAVPTSIAAIPKCVVAKPPAYSESAGGGWAVARASLFLSPARTARTAVRLCGNTEAGHYLLKAKIVVPRNERRQLQGGRQTTNKISAAESWCRTLLQLQSRGFRKPQQQVFPHTRCPAVLCTYIC